MLSARVAGLVSACCLAAAALGGGALAAKGGGDTAGAPVYMGHSEFNENCPGITYHFRSGAAEPYGYVMYDDASGVSRATGTLDPNSGKFHLTLTSLDGNGPTGTVDGVKGQDGSLKAVLKGPGCSHLTVSNAQPDYWANEANGKGGTGGHR